jgi:hypothetical protein
MQRPGKWIILALVVLGGGLVTRVVVSQPPASTPPAAANSFANLFQEARPHLEAVLGHSLDFEPRFSTATVEQLQQVPDPDLDAHLRWHFAHLRGPTLERTRQVARQIAAKAVIAQYVEGKEVIVVVPESVDSMAGWDESLAAVKSPAFIQLALVGEVVRWELDRRYHLAQLRAECHDAEEFHALQSIIEGRIQSVTQQVAAKLGSQALHALLAQRYLRVPDDAPDPGLRTASHTYLQGCNRACAHGLNFFTALEQEGLREEFREAPVFITRRPRQMTMVTRPEAWVRAFCANRPELERVLQPLESSLPADRWQASQQTWTPAMMGQVAALFGASRERVDKIATTWDEGRTLVWIERQHPDHQVALSVVRHASAAGARAAFGLAVDLQRQQDTLPPGTCGPLMQVIASKTTALHLEGFDEAVRCDKQIRFGGGPPLPVSLLLARAGDLMIECTGHGVPVDAELSELLVRAVRAAAL